MQRNTVMSHCKSSLATGHCEPHYSSITLILKAWQDKVPPALKGLLDGHLAGRKWTLQLILRSKTDEKVTLVCHHKSQPRQGLVLHSIGGSCDGVSAYRFKCSCSQYHMCECHGELLRSSGSANIMEAWPSARSWLHHVIDERRNISPIVVNDTHELGKWFRAPPSSAIALNSLTIISRSMCFCLRTVRRLFTDVHNLILRCEQSVFASRNLDLDDPAETSEVACTCRAPSTGRMFRQLHCASVHSTCRNIVRLLVESTKSLHSLHVDMSGLRNLAAPDVKLFNDGLRSKWKSRLMYLIGCRVHGRSGSQLKHLNIQDECVDVTAVNSFFPSLQHLEITCSQLSATTSSTEWFPYLETAIVYYSSANGGGADHSCPLLSGGSCLPRLTHFRQSFGQLKMTHLSQQHCPRLKLLELDPVTLTDDQPRLPPHVQHLHISWCDVDFLRQLLLTTDETCLRILRVSEPVHSDEGSWKKLQDDLSERKVAFSLTS